MNSASLLLYHKFSNKLLFYKISNHYQNKVIYNNIHIKKSSTLSWIPKETKHTAYISNNRKIQYKLQFPNTRFFLTSQNTNNNDNNNSSSSRNNSYIKAITDNDIIKIGHQDIIDNSESNNNADSSISANTNTITSTNTNIQLDDEVNYIIDYDNEFDWIKDRPVKIVQCFEDTDFDIFHHKKLATAV